MHWTLFQHHSALGGWKHRTCQPHDKAGPDSDAIIFNQPQAYWDVTVCSSFIQFRGWFISPFRDQGGKLSSLLACSSHVPLVLYFWMKPSYRKASLLFLQAQNDVRMTLTFITFALDGYLCSTSFPIILRSTGCHYHSRLGNQRSQINLYIIVLPRFLWKESCLTRLTFPLFSPLLANLNCCFLVLLCVVCVCACMRVFVFKQNNVQKLILQLQSDPNHIYCYANPTEVHGGFTCKGLQSWLWAL